MAADIVVLRPAGKVIFILNPKKEDKNDGQEDKGYD